MLFLVISIFIPILVLCILSLLGLILEPFAIKANCTRDGMVTGHYWKCPDSFDQKLILESISGLTAAVSFTIVFPLLLFWGAYYPFSPGILILGFLVIAYFSTQDILNE